ncbi:hypothetical protein NHQ30_008005 [Ciborinia camelliae]|nr:hypothetical protein NHQ30_008005 [Ciborinia camelliae]
MEIPMRGQKSGFNTPLPAICVQDSHHPDRYSDTDPEQLRFRYRSTTSTPAGPMSIPNAREGPPPPLPPPRYIPDIFEVGRPDIGWQWANQHRGVDWEGSVSAVPPGSSLYGSYSRKSIPDERSYIERRDSSNATTTAQTAKDTNNHVTALPKDEGYSSLSASNASIGSTQSRTSASFQSSVHDTYQTSVQAYDKSVLQKLGGGRGDNFTSSRPFAKPTFSSSANDASPTSRLAREHGHPSLKPLSLPIHTHKPALAESPINPWTDSPLSSGISPGNPYNRLGRLNSFDYRSPTDIIDSERSPLPYPRRSGSIADDASSIASQSRDSYQMPSPEHEEGFHMEDTGLRRLQIGEEYYGRSEGYSPRSATAGQKRRASSPPRDDGLHLRTVGSASDLARRRESGSRSTPSPRFHSTSTSISSTTSLARNSYTSAISALPVSSTTCYNRLIHGSIPPNPMDISSDMSYGGSMSLNPSPRGSISARTTHHRTLSESRPLTNARKMPEALGHVKHNSAPSRQGGFICECCPKKPKKFDTQEELNAHEQEKQYECQYCRNRFKNKNEAERHQNSLHLRRHSWSCAALADWAHAFHPCPSRPNDADTCGYCGEDFPRSGVTSPGPNGPPMRMATNDDWDHRVAHLQEMHKFGECNHAKKFFRADHFRQHLKHSHAGTSGKWTNMLENACMIDEPPPEPLRAPERVSPGGVRVGRINEEDERL